MNNRSPRNHEQQRNSSIYRIYLQFLQLQGFFQKRMKIAQTSNRQGNIHDIDTSSRQYFQMIAPKANADSGFIGRNSTAIQHFSHRKYVSAVHHKSAKSRNFQISLPNHLPSPLEGHPKTG